MRDLRQDVINLLEIKKPVKILFRFLPSDSAANYSTLRDDDWSILEHRIRIHPMHRGRSHKALLVHELIHAWQEERGFTDIHGVSFQLAAGFVASALQQLGHKIKGPIFDKDVDL